MCHSPGGEIRSSAGGVVRVGRGAHSTRSLGEEVGAADGEVRSLGGEVRSLGGEVRSAGGAAAGKRIMARKPDTGVSAASPDRSSPGRPVPVVAGEVVAGQVVA